MEDKIIIELYPADEEQNGVRRLGRAADGESFILGLPLISRGYQCDCFACMTVFEIYRYFVSQRGEGHDRATRGRGVGRPMRSRAFREAR